MSAITTVVSEAPAQRSRIRPLIRAGAIGGVAGAVAAMLVGAVARAADVPLEVEGEAIPIAGLATVTLISTVLGIGLAFALKQRGRFVGVCAVLTAASLIPAIAQPDHTATKVVLVLAHLVAAAVVVPMLARQLPGRATR